VGITYRQLDYWARTGLVVPTVRGASGSGSHRLYSFTDMRVLKVVKRLLDAGVSLQNIRLAVQHLRAHGASDLAATTLFSDGIIIYECRGPDEIADLLRAGQGVFGWRRCRGLQHGEPVETLPHRRAGLNRDVRAPRRGEGFDGLGVAAHTGHRNLAR
jgi:DNA-binding transcriptional MerR regulator